MEESVMGTKNRKNPDHPAAFKEKSDGKISSFTAVFGRRLFDKAKNPPNSKTRLFWG